MDIDKLLKEAEERKQARAQRRAMRKLAIEEFDQDVERLTKKYARQLRKEARMKFLKELDREFNTTKLTPAQPPKLKVKELMPLVVKSIEPVKMTPKEAPVIEEVVMTGEKVATKRSDIPRLRKNVLADIEKFRSTIGIPQRTLTRMIREAETGREATVLKLAKELSDKYEAKYKEAMKKSKSKN
jgi:hypothetical protein